MLISSLNGEWVATHRERNRAWFETYKRLDLLCHRVRAKLRCPKNDKPRFFVDALYLRSLGLFEAISILAEQGLVGESLIISRSLLELCFVLVAAAKDKDFAKECLSGSDVSELRLMRCSLPRLKDQVPAELMQRLEMRQQELERASKSVTGANIEETSKRAGLHDRYDLDYRALCRYTHFSPYNLDQYLAMDMDKQCEVVGFRWGPSDHNFGLSMTESAHTMMEIVKTVCSYHNLDERGELDRIASELARLGRRGPVFKPPRG